MTTLPLCWRIASALSRTPFRARREFHDEIGRILDVDPNLITDALDAQLEAWREQERGI